MSFTELETDPDTGRRRFRGHVIDGVPAGKYRQSKVTKIVIQLPSAGLPAVAPKAVTVRDDDLDEKQKLTGPAEAFWPTADYTVRPEGSDMIVFEKAPSGEEREVKRYPANRFGFEKVDDNTVIRRRELSATDRAARAEVMKQNRLGAQAQLEGMNRRSRDRWAALRGTK